MGYLSVLLAALAGFIFGAVWYSVLSKPWVAASGIRMGPDGKPENYGPTTFVLSGIDRWDEGLISGLGIGLFFISPWIMINNAYGQRPFRLTLIDGGYATFGCAIIGLVLTLI